MVEGDSADVSRDKRSLARGSATMRTSLCIFKQRNCCNPLTMYINVYKC